MADEIRNQTPEEAAIRERRLAPLVAAGVDQTSVDALIKALSDESVGVQLAAMYLLKEKKARAAVPRSKRY